MTDWNAERYHRVSQPQFEWGVRVLEQLTLAGDETVIDAGCGTGRLTALLLEKLPRGRVIALDASAAMLEVARRELARFGDRVQFAQADLGALTLGATADVVFSTATFHWVPDHQALFDGLFRALKPNGRLHAQCGAFGNLAAALRLATEVITTAPFAGHLTDLRAPTTFATAEESVERLKRAGFAEPKAWLTPAPFTFATPLDYRDFVTTVVLRHAMAALPEALREPYADAVTAAATPALKLDYVRLDLRATKTR